MPFFHIVKNERKVNSTHFLPTHESKRLAGLRIEQYPDGLILSDGKNVSYQSDQS
jgi:hypothetical protein